ncbi:hypothetical protein [Metabacillus malikii]|uniref:Ca2+/Na+ antiporter n=1 Tax=Metabacillus malikii TaxID=1504265 RepID=A0ABT9ZGM4_9BACI|nr:hypothetical protein [Metabacillus malikii]MDQ0231421.1 Ca2+/Na+ antiporter [Metabacillus malikii]
MVGTELAQHLQHLDEQLTQLMNTFKEFKNRTAGQQKDEITLRQHILYCLATIFVIVAITLVIGIFLPEVRPYLFYIELIQSVLAIALYFFFVRKLLNVEPKEKKQAHTPSADSMFELDQKRFAILQELGKSPIPFEYLTPSTVKKMHKLVSSGMCLTIDECLKEVKKSLDKKHEQEIQVMKTLQIISFH